MFCYDNQIVMLSDLLKGVVSDAFFCSDGRTAIQLAAKNCVEALVAGGADINGVNISDAGGRSQKPQPEKKSWVSGMRANYFAADS